MDSTPIGLRLCTRLCYPKDVITQFWHVQVIAFFEQPGLKEYYDQLWAATDPTRPHGPTKLTGHGLASVTSLLPRIQLARRLMVEVSSRHRSWNPLLAARATSDQTGKAHI